MDNLTAVKMALRVTASDYDSEITSLINSAKLDLGISNVNEVDDELYLRAIILYVKGHYGYDERQSEYLKRYEQLKISLSLSGDYRDEM